MRWLLLFAVACSERPIYVPEGVRHVDAPDLAQPDLAPALCSSECGSDGCPCVASSDCCTLFCDPQSHLCTAPVERFDLTPPPPPDLATPPPPPDLACSEGVQAGGVCTTTADCCGPGPLVCMVPTGSLTGICHQDCGCQLCRGDLCLFAGHCCVDPGDCCSKVCEIGADGVGHCGRI